MPWDPSEQGGFTTGKPWLKLNPDHQEINVAKDLADSDGVYHYYQQLIKLRHEEPLVTTGVFELLDPEDPNLFVYLRKGEKETLLVAGNFSAKTQKWQTPESLQQQAATILICNANFSKQLGSTLTLPPFGTVVYKLKQS